MAWQRGQGKVKRVAGPDRMVNGQGAIQRSTDRWKHRRRKEEHKIVEHSCHVRGNVAQAGATTVHKTVEAGHGSL
ncbi:hypothetical protein NDA11_003141 [Ustilago hordei]|uniref:Uncharacterized protein n=1 Tax=Ustilago hordei TaxID=120017 RepID=I2FU13_USTHO|nr:uncharacterized protein UHO2_06088 [Ustilago hordei]KAJ1037924.1 hypothetical protein NDA10_007654 [Ustilago hordei]KAJ1575098.1 hypothetical protein NDA15_007536 [Ustilago hordei]KAJ1594033.1 hypothetical protein NDA12_003503 [Ustilago hordei]KAJ1594734.1 hypothetical protein NDA11_003141 [Ustilago hordei]KAJ1597638.1 hypothetical protein NDA14_006748 [Ustilago hordei]